MVKEIKCPVCLTTITVDSEGHESVTCPSCQSYFPWKFAEALEEFEALKKGMSDGTKN